MVCQGIWASSLSHGDMDVKWSDFCFIKIWLAALCNAEVSVGGTSLKTNKIIQIRNDSRLRVRALADNRKKEATASCV